MSETKLPNTLFPKMGSQIKMKILRVLFFFSSFTVLWLFKEVYLSIGLQVERNYMLKIIESDLKLCSLSELKRPSWFNLSNKSHWQLISPLIVGKWHLLQMRPSNIILKSSLTRVAQVHNAAAGEMGTFICVRLQSGLSPGSLWFLI